MASTPFETVVREHGAHVLRVCMATVGSNEAEDAWSETFVAALRAWQQAVQAALQQLEP